VRDREHRQHPGDGFVFGSAPAGCAQSTRLFTSFIAGLLPSGVVSPAYAIRGARLR
jgi:Na+/phosphate symporter